MAEHKDREHFIPMRKGELIDVLAADKELTDDDRELFRQFCQLVTATYHFEFNHHLEELKTAYAPFDPDTDTRTLLQLTAEEKQRRLNELLRDFAWLLERANYKHLSRQELEPSLDTASAWGIHMDVDFGAFEHLAIFVRGDALQKRTRRRLLNFYRLEEVEVPVFQRLAIIVKLRKHRRLPSNTDTRHVYLKLFKDIPKLDIEMLLPGSRVRFSYLDQGKIGMPLLSGLGLAVWNLITAGINIVTDLFATILGAGGNPTLALWGIASGAAGYGYKSYYGYQQTKQRYHLTLTQSLYFQNLDSNAGVLFRLLDEAEEQECREAVLAYFFLWRHASENGWTSDELDDAIEQYLERHADLKIDFEIGDALDKLETLRIVEKRGDRYRAVSVAKALEILDANWDNYFKYSSSAPAAPPVSAK